MNWFLLSLCVLFYNGGSNEAPTFIAQQGWILAMPPYELLDHPEVQRNLSSGLTTTIRLQMEARLDRDWQQGGALIDIRFEPWDEVYYIHYATMDGEITSETIESSQALNIWWRNLRLRVLPWNAMASPTALRASIEVIPFSASEQNEAREWFASNSALSNAADSTEATGTLAEPGLINLIVATSIKRKVILRLRWRTLVMAGAEAIRLP